MEEDLYVKGAKYSSYNAMALIAFSCTIRNNESLSMGAITLYVIFLKLVQQKLSPWFQMLPIALNDTVMVLTEVLKSLVRGQFMATLPTRKHKLTAVWPGPWLIDHITSFDY